MHRIMLAKQTECVSESHVRISFKLKNVCEKKSAGRHDFVPIKDCQIAALTFNFLFINLL